MSRSMDHGVPITCCVCRQAFTVRNTETFHRETVTSNASSAVAQRWYCPSCWAEDKKRCHNCRWWGGLPDPDLKACQLPEEKRMFPLSASCGAKDGAGRSLVQFLPFRDYGCVQFEAKGETP